MLLLMSRRYLSEPCVVNVREWGGDTTPASTSPYHVQTYPPLRFHTQTANPKEICELKTAFGEREAAVKAGVILNGRRFEIHKQFPEHDPPLVYGRTMHPKEDPLNSSGFGILKYKTSSGKPAYVVVTYEMPNISARVMPIVIKFAKDNL